MQSIMDTTAALGVGALLVALICTKQFSFTVMEILLQLPRPIITVLLLLIPVGLYMKRMIYTSLISIILIVYLLQDVWKTYLSSDARRLYLEMGRDQARFDPGKSIDLQFANRTATHDSPNMLYQASDAPLLIYPPSDEVLEEMCG